MFFPGFYHLPVLAEHPFSRAGSIDKNLVKISGKIVLQLTRFFTEDQHVPDAEYFQILKKPLCTGTADIIGNQYPFSHKLCSKFRCFSAGGCTYIQHTFSR